MPNNQHLINWFHENYEPGRPHVRNTVVRRHYEMDTHDFSYNQQEFPRALREAGLPVERTGAGLIIRGYTRKAGK